MKHTVLILMLALTGCAQDKGASSGGSGSGYESCGLAPMGPTVAGAFGAMATDSNGTPVGNHFADDWYWIGNYLFQVTGSGELRSTPGFVYSDASCGDLIGEIDSYPTLATGDTYVFQFDGRIYEHGNFIGPYNNGDGYYFKGSKGGKCTKCSGNALQVYSVRLHTATNIQLKYVLPISYVTRKLRD